MNRETTRTCHECRAAGSARNGISARSERERAARQFVAFNKHPPTELGTSDIRAWALFMLTVAHRSASTVDVALAALRFLYAVTLGRPDVVTAI